MDQQEIEKSIAEGAMTLLRHQRADRRDCEDKDVTYLRNRIERLERATMGDASVPSHIHSQVKTLRMAFDDLYADKADEACAEPAEEISVTGIHIARHMAQIVASERESSVFSDNGPKYEQMFTRKMAWEHGRDHMNKTVQRALCHHYPKAFTKEEHDARGSVRSSDPTHANYSSMADSIKPSSEREGLPVKGYNPTQSAENIELVDFMKIAEERAMRLARSVFQPERIAELPEEIGMNDDCAPAAEKTAEDTDEKALDEVFAQSERINAVKMVEKHNLLRVDAGLLMTMDVSGADAYNARVMGRGWGGLAIIGRPADIDLIHDTWIQYAALVVSEDGQVFKQRYPEDDKPKRDGRALVS